MSGGKTVITIKSAKPVQYETSGSAGLDLKAHLPEHGERHVEPGCIAAIPTGCFVQKQKSFLGLILKWLGFVPEIQIRPRSGLALKHRIFVGNSPGCVDQDFPNEIQVLLYNASQVRFTVKDGDRIAQATFHWVYRPKNLRVSKNIRVGGFGSTGK